MGEMKLSPVHPAHSHSAGYPFVVSAPRVGSSGLWSLAPSTNILAWWAARLAAVFGSLGTRGSLSFFCSLGWLLGVLRALFAHELPPSSRLGLAVQRTTVTMVPPSWSRAREKG